MGDSTTAAALGSVDLETAELELNGSIYEGFSTAIMVKGQPRTIALCREYGDAVQLMALVERGRENPSEVGPANPEWEARAAALKSADREADPEGYKADGTVAGILLCATMLETYVPDVLPANERGQVPFVRAMTESTVETIRAYVASLGGEEITGPIRYVAVRFGDKVVTAPMPGFRHHHILTVAHGLGFKPSSVDDQGFALADGTFIGRTDAARLALESGQVNKLIAPPDLYSEDIW